MAQTSLLPIDQSGTRQCLFRSCLQRSKVQRWGRVCHEARASKLRNCKPMTVVQRLAAAASNGALSSLADMDFKEDDPVIATLLSYRQAKRAAFDNQYLVGLLLQQRKLIVIAALALVVCTASNLAGPVLSGMLVEALVQQQPWEHYVRLLAILTVGYTIEPLLTRVYMANMLKAGERFLAALRQELFRNLLMQRVEFFDKHSASELTALISVDLDTIRTFIFNNVSRDRGLRALLEAVGAVIVLFFLSWQLAPMCSLVIISTAIAAAVYKRATKTVENQQAQALQRMSAVASQAFDNIRTVRSFAGESLERERFQEFVQRSYRAGREFASAKAWFETSNRAAIHASLLALYAWGGWLVSRGHMPVGVMISAIGFTFSLMFATQGIVNTLSEMRRAAGAIGRVRGMIQSSQPDPSMFGALPPGAWWEVANGAKPVTEPYGNRAGEAAVAAARTGDLELRDVCFSYPVRSEVQVLKHVDILLRRGTVTAIVGRSGAGKSTVASLLSRFYEPQSGGVFLAGRSAESYSRGEWARAVSMVSQEPVLFSGTIADNIAYGLFGKATQAEIEGAAQAANAHEFITQLPAAYETVVGERGVLLSGGQRQRIAIARALLKDSPIIILDEATSALDAVSEQLVQQAVKRLVSGRTVLVIAHRLSTIQSAGQIVVMQDGAVVEVGTHTELMEAGGAYRQLMSTQGMMLANS